MQTKFDPAKFGPGIWHTMHSIAANKTNTIEEKKHFVSIIYALHHSFKCKECKVHFGEYLEKHPPMVSIEKKHATLGDIGCFIWTWEFHNHVNAFLGKPIMPLETCYSYYKEKDMGVCFDCGTGNKTQKNPPIGGYSLAIPDMVAQYKKGKIQPKPFG